MTRQAEVMDMVAEAAVTPPPQGCWEWNGEHGRLSSRDSAMPGPWRGNVVPHMRHWQDLITSRRLGRRYAIERAKTIADHRQRLLDLSFWKGGTGYDQYAHMVEQIWLVAGTQSTKTRSFLYAALGYNVDQHPAPSGLVLPRRKDFKRVLDNRVKPFFVETPALHRHFPSGRRARSQAITLEAWTLDTMTLFHLCGEVADDLRQFPMRDIYCDEFDLLPLDVEGQGDPLELAIDRGKTWSRSKLIVGATTPTQVHRHGWRRLCSGSHERLAVVCPRCKAVDVLDPDQIRTPDGATAEEVRLRHLATIECKHCGTSLPDDGTKDHLISEAAAADLYIPGKWEISAQHTTGIWTPSAHFDAGHRLIDMAPIETTVRSGHMNSLYSPFITLSEYKAKELGLAKKGDRAQRVAFVNGWRCEPTIAEVVTPPDIEVVTESATVYGYAHGSGPEVIAEPVHLAIVCDQQGNSRDTAWFPYSVQIFSATETWLIESGRVDGFPGLDKLEGRKWLVNGAMMPAEVTTLDGNNGTMRVPLQQWAAAKPKARMLLCGRFWPDFNWRQRDPGGAKEKRNKKIITGARVFSFHANAYKTELDGMMRGREGAKRWNLPDDTPQFFLDSLTAEEQVEREIRIPGFATKQRVMVWEPRRVHDETGAITVRTDNHWWDTQTMAPVVADIMGWNTVTEPTKTMTAADWFKKGKR